MGKKTLFLLRHAKAITGELSMLDQDRPLSDRGFKDASRLGEKLHKKGFQFDLILTSPAIRTITTAQLIINHFNLKSTNILIEPQVYQASDLEIIGLISMFQKKYDQILLIGHNPSLAALASRFAGEPVAMPTCCLTRVLFNFKDWQKICEEPKVKFNFIN